MQKAYDSVSWFYLLNCLKRIKMCPHFVEFFGGIHNNRFNRVMTNFGLTDGYTVYNRLDQEEVFLPLLWKIFYDSLLCEVKRHKQLIGYRVHTNFFTKTGRVDPKSGKTSFFAVEAFVDDTISIGNCMTATQQILNIASKFFFINDISINMNKMVAISINQDVKNISLSISGSKISIAKKSEFYRYLEESESESEETSEKTSTRPVTETSSQSKNQETHNQEKELNIREATFRNTQGNIIPPLLRPISPPAENSNKIATLYIARLTDFSGKEEETDILETKPTSFAEFKNALLEYFSDPNAIIQLQNEFNTIKQSTNETVTQYLA
ncbi:hypothetical protein G9A89_018871 [Geosiphon pyriformis]|nr:hypothetical protein G9A89_018871 [Geosiphon pyriformis]